MEKMTLTVHELAQVLQISRPKAYELVHRADFPVIHIGRRVLVPVEGLKKWMEKEMRKGKDDE